MVGLSPITVEGLPMKRLRSPTIAAAVAAVLASTTGYCVVTRTGPGVPTPENYVSPPVRLLPPAVVPYPPAEPEEG